MLVLDVIGGELYVAVGYMDWTQIIMILILLVYRKPMHSAIENSAPEIEVYFVGILYLKK